MRLAPAIIVLVIPFLADSQSAFVDTSEIRGGTAQQLMLPEFSMPPSSMADSLDLRLAMIEVAKAQLSVDGSGIWRRLVPSVTIGCGLGIRDIAFPEPGGTLILPRDTYRISATLSLTDLLDGAKRARAELLLAESETRLAALVRKQSLARRALEKKGRALASESCALHDELSVRRSLAAFQEMLFSQGRVDFHAVAVSRIELIRIREEAARCEASLRDVVETLRAESPR